VSIRPFLHVVVSIILPAV